MKISFSHIVLLLCLCLTQLIYSQEDGVVAFDLPVRNSLKFNRYALNPTFSFVREQNKYLSFTNKREWVQFDNAPQTYLFSYSGRFRENIGIGLGLFQQNYGVLTTFGGVANFAYNVVINRDSNLTFGTNISFNNSGINTGEVITNFPDSSLDNIPSNLLLNLNPGINYGTAFFDFGVSINNLVSYNLTTSEIIEDNPEQSIQGHLMYTGYLDSRGFFDESKFTSLFMSEFKTDQTVLSGIVMLTVPKGIWAQLGYNTLYGASGGLGLNITEQIALEYNFEKAIGDLDAFGNSHEITLAYKFKNNKRYNYSGDDDEEAFVIAPKKKSKPVSKSNRKPVKKPEPKADEDTQVKLAEETKVQEEAESKRLAEEQAKEEEAEKAKQAEQDRLAELAAEAKAQEEAETKRIAEEQAKTEESEKAKQAEQERLAQLAAKAKAQEEAEAKRLAEEQAKAEEAEKAKQAEQERLAQLAAEAKAQEEAEAKRLAEEQARAEEVEKAKQVEQERLEQLAAEAKAQEEAEAKRLAEEQVRAEEAEKAKQAEQERLAQLAAEAKAQEEAEAKRLTEEQAKAEQAEQERLAAEEKVTEEPKTDEVQIPIATDAVAKSMENLTKLTDESKIQQEDLLDRLSQTIDSKQKDLDDLKEENDLSEQGIVRDKPKVFKSVSAENAALESLQVEIDEVIESQNSKISELEDLYDERLKDVPNEDDSVNVFYLRKIRGLKTQQRQVRQAKAKLLTKLETIKVATEIERKRRIKRAAYDNQDARYSKDRAALNLIKENTPVSSIPLTEDDFDFGERQNNIQIIKDVKNVDSGYYLVIAVHSDVSKRDEFLTKTVSSGQSDVDFFFDVSTSKYFIYYKKFDNIESARSAIESKGNKPYDSKMSIVKIEN